MNYLSRHCSSQGDPRGGAEEPHVHTRSGERGLVAGHGNVAAGHQLTTGSCGQAIDHGNDGDRVVPDQHHDLQKQTYPLHLRAERSHVKTFFFFLNIYLLVIGGHISLFYFLCGAEDQTPCLTSARQASELQPQPHKVDFKGQSILTPGIQAKQGKSTGANGVCLIFFLLSFLPVLPEGAAASAETAVAANVFAAAPSVSVGPKATDAVSLRLPAAGC